MSLCLLTNWKSRQMFLRIRRRNSKAPFNLAEPSGPSMLSPRAEVVRHIADERGNRSGDSSQ